VRTGPAYPRYVTDCDSRTRTPSTMFELDFTDGTASIRLASRVRDFCLSTLESISSLLQELSKVISWSIYSKFIIEPDLDAVCQHTIYQQECRYPYPESGRKRNKNRDKTRKEKRQPYSYSITTMVVNASMGLDLLWNIGIFLVRMICTINVSSEGIRRTSRYGRDSHIYLHRAACPEAT